MDEISQARVAEVEQLKDAIGWSWTEITKRMSWGVAYLTQFRQVKRPIEERWLQYLREVAHAVQSIPLPSDAAEPESLEPAVDPFVEEFRKARFHPQAEAEITEVRVMLLDDIAQKLADEYMALRRNSEMSAENREGAQWMIGRLAEQMGVTAEVRRLVVTGPMAAGPATPTPATRMPEVQPAPPARPWQPPQPSREIGGLDTF